ncbi:MFS transporter [Neptunicella marina]|uniref:MFS transporter n=1 Tax=Neptunicella marina TaxID=2125989 RepID=A0A8J6ISF1_9ALTE|nr:MFS transporter [Neptunicella marina]MBC3764733.1 MFS transporter [Neptunicella marina]
MDNTAKLFRASCLALIVTAMTFAIRAGILTQLSQQFTLNDTELGLINSMAFLGFPVAMMVLGLLYNLIGAKRILTMAFICHLAGLLLTIYAQGFWGLLISTFLIGFANGAVEAACNPLIADMYPDRKTTMLNRFHVWFPGGIVIGALVSEFMTMAGLSWQLQIAVMLIPTVIYGYLVFSESFPPTRHIESSTRVNITSLLSPLYLFMIVCMTLTATTELGTQQWVGRILAESGASPMIILALGTGLMAVGRQFAGPVVHALNPSGVLLVSAIVASVGIYLLSIATGPMVYLATIVFACGVMYFWPTMIGFIGEYQPKTGALGMSLIGGAGMFATGIWNPVIGSWIDQHRAEAINSGLTGSAAELAAGQSTLSNMLLFPLTLVVLFTVLYIFRQRFAHFRVSHQTGAQ